jgi:hypoxanthine-DNA glycosylase
MRKFGLPPIVDEKTEILILGTLPSDASLTKRQYYANSGNDFWKLIGASLHENLEGLSYESKIETLKTYRIGLWDAYHNCIRKGSMDENIGEQELNDFTLLRAIAPRLKLICINGKEARTAEDSLHGLGYKTLALLSSSGANRGRQKERLSQWKSSVVVRPKTAPSVTEFLE